MKRLSIIGVLAIAANVTLAQNFDYSVQNQWHAVPAKHTINSNYNTASAVGVLDDRSIEYKVEGKEIVMNTTYHRIVKINDDKGIEMYNKIYIPVSPNALITDLKARTVLPNGKVIDVPADKIKQIEEDGRLYKLFAMEGVEKGAEVEYIYSIKKAPNYFGTEVFQTGSVPYQKLQFKLVVPGHLKFDAKGFNGFKVSKDSLIGEQRIIVGYDENVNEIEEEKYAVRDPYLKRVDFKLSYNLANNNGERLYTWKDFAKRAYTVYTTVSSKEEKPLANLISKINLKSTNTEVEKIIAIEEYIKSTINIDKELVGEDVDLFDRIVKSKSATTSGIIRLFASIFEKTGINYQLVFVSRRDDLPLDEEIENWNRVDETVFYFPSTGKYISPSSVDLRYPYIPAYWAGARGLFLKGTTIGSFRTAIGVFAEINMEPFEQHAHNMEVGVRFDENLENLLIDSKQVLTGYGAANYRPYYTFLPKDKQDEVSMEVVKSVAKSTDIKNIKIQNALLSDFTDNKPFSISAEIKSNELIEKAGNKVLLKVGELIGPQEQMYQEKPRQLPIELAYPHVLNRKINLKIPEGYTIKNPDDLKLAVEYKDGSEVTMGFVSSYTIKDNVLSIDVAETYKRLKYPLAQFENFKKVINAAADFNKIILVLEKKS